MRATSEKYRLNSYDGEELPFENYMKLDNNQEKVSLDFQYRSGRRMPC